MTALSGNELLAWVQRTSDQWFALLQTHEEILSLPCDILSTGTVAKLVQHIVAVELRYAQRLQGVAETSYDAIPFDTTEQLRRTHAVAMDMLRSLLRDDGFDWEESISFQTRSAGCLRAPRRTILVHTLMHSVRHYAQLATLVRQHGIQTTWALDYLFMGATAPS